MKRFNVYISEYDWLVRVFVAVSCIDTESIMDTLYSIGFSDRLLDDARKHLEKCNRNQGACFTNPESRISVVVIGITTSGAEFYDSSQHETGHLATHIALEEGLDLTGEEVRYIQGDFARMIYPHVKDLLCDCCRKSNLKHH